MYIRIQDISWNCWTKKANRVQGQRVDFEIWAETDGANREQGEENPGKTTPNQKHAETRQDQKSLPAEG